METNDSTSAKRQKISHGNDDDADPPNGVSCYHPMSFVTWNCNGFSTRAKYGREDLRRLVQSTGGADGGGPDMICMQEARLKAEGTGEQRGRPLHDKDTEAVREALRDAFAEYRPFWSLADKKYAGTLTLVRRACLRACGYENGEADFVAFTFRSAIDLMLRRLGTTRKECGLEEEDTSPVAAKANQQSPKKQRQQTSLKSFFAPKPKLKGTVTVGTTGPTKKHKRPHHPEGRFQFFFFPGMDVIQTYVPNNGGKEESFERRRNWDKDMKQFLTDRKRILKMTSESSKVQTKEIDSGTNRKLLWCGDMNATLSHRDGSHWESKNPNGDDSPEVYEWWRDTKKCFSKFSDLAKNPPRDPEYQGIPGFTPAERRRFRELLQVGDFCDLWREQYPTGVCDESDDNRWEQANYTWRGTLAKTPGGYAKYQGRGQRLDYFLLSPSKFGVGAVRSAASGDGGDDDSSDCEFKADCRIRGYGTRMEGLFCGSDHSVVELVLTRI